MGVMWAYCMLLCCSMCAVHASRLQATCKALCLDKFGREYRRNTGGGSVYSQLKCDATCQPCWIACRTESSSLQSCTASCSMSKNEEVCRQGCTFYDQLTLNHSDKHTCLSARLSSVDLLCMNLHGRADSASVLSSFVLRFIGTPPVAPIVYAIEFRQRLYNPTTDLVTVSPWARLGTKTDRTFSLKHMLVGVEYKFRVTPYGPCGPLSTPIESHWIRTFSGNEKLVPPETIEVVDQSVQGEGPNLSVLLSWTPADTYPSCFYHLVWRNEDKAESDTFPVDEDMSYLVNDVSYSRNYTVTIQSVSQLPIPRVESTPVMTAFVSKSCLHTFNYNFSICGPGMVENLTITVYNETVDFDWLPPVHTTNWNRISKYELQYRSLPHLGYCIKHINEKIHLYSNETSHSVGDLSAGCHYSFAIRAIASNERNGTWLRKLFSVTRSLYENELLVDSTPPFHPAYFLIVIVCVLALVSLVTLAYLKLKRSSLDLSKHPLTMQLSTLLGKALNRNSIYEESVTSPKVWTTPQSSIAFNPHNHVHINSTSCKQNHLSRKLSSVSSCSSDGGKPGLTQVHLHRLPSDTSRTESLTYPHFQRGIILSEASLKRHFVLKTLLGEGAFGCVYMALSTAPKYPKVVAVKTLKSELYVTAEAERTLVEEMTALSSLGPHPNLVALLGLCKESPALILEYCPLADLKTYLSKIRQQILEDQRLRRRQPDGSPDISMPRSIQAETILSYSRQIALAMEHITKEGFVHRDLAARNVLVCDEGRVVKVSDLGLARRGSEYIKLDNRGQLPVKWMAPESIRHSKFDQKTDVWSFGVVMWEIVTLGGTPFSGMGVSEFLEEVKLGVMPSLPQPHNCSGQLFEVMQTCWAQDPKCRPAFNLLKDILEQMMEFQSQYLSLDITPQESYYQQI